MCLNNVYLTRKQKNSHSQTAAKDGVFIGYKSFMRGLDGEVTNSSFGPKKQLPKIGQWVTANNQRINSNQPNNMYTSGFHIFLNLTDAKNYRPAVFLVEYKDIVAVGKQASKDKGVTVVAKKMRLLERLV